MNTIVITAGRHISLDGLRRLLSGHWQLLKTPPDRLALEELGSRVYVYHPKMENGEVDFKQVFVDYSLIQLVKKVVGVIGDNPEWMIDNDCDDPLPGDQFVARLRSDSGWNWVV